MTSEWLTRIEAARYARMSVTTFSRRIRCGTMPRGHGPDGGRKVWSRSDIDAAIRGEQAGSADPILDEIRKAVG